MSAEMPPNLSEFIRVTGYRNLLGLSEDKPSSDPVPEDSVKMNALEDDLLSPYKLSKHTPNKGNGYSHSEEMYKHFAEMSKVQRELDLKLSHEIADPMSYMGTYADYTVRFR